VRSLWLTVVFLEKFVAELVPELLVRRFARVFLNRSIWSLTISFGLYSDNLQMSVERVHESFGNSFSRTVCFRSRFQEMSLLHTKLLGGIKIDPDGEVYHEPGIGDGIENCGVIWVS